MSTELQVFTGVEAQDEARHKLLDNYNAKEHLIKISTKQGMKDYYPAAWRLYELSLKYEAANFSTKLIYHNQDTGAIIVRARLYLGPDYKASPKKAEAMKQGTFAQLDKIETAAKARAARDFGISTELALDMEDEDNGNGEVVSTLARSTVVSPAPHVVDSQPAPTMATEQQLAGIRKLCDYLGKGFVPTNDFSYEQARSLLEELTGEYRKLQEARKATPAQATSASPKPAQARQEPAQGTDLAATNEAKIRALLKEYQALCPEKCTAKTWYFKVLRAAFNIPEGPLPANDAYTPEHVIALAQFVKPYRKQAAQTPV